MQIQIQFIIEQKKLQINFKPRSITFTGTVSYDLVYNGVGNIWTDKYSITIDINPQTGAVLGISFYKIRD
jgi:hypothetical protein